MAVLADYLKIPEVARRLGVSEPTVRRMVKGGKLPSVFIGGAYRVSEEDLGKYVENARVKPGKAQASPSSEPSFNDALEEERRRTEIEEIRESYRESREGLDRYCDSWDRRIAADDLDRQAVREFIHASEALLPALHDSVAAELIEIGHVVGFAEDGGASDEMWAQASLKPIVDRYHAIGRTLEGVWREHLAEAGGAPDTETVFDFQAFQALRAEHELRRRRTG